jgi:hypothetical protein
MVVAHGSCHFLDTPGLARNVAPTGETARGLQHTRDVSVGLARRATTTDDGADRWRDTR